MTPPQIPRRVWRFFFILPPLFCIWLYWYGLKCWFQQDDFAWLSLHTQVWDWRSFWTQMFSPMAQGTIRPWSERGFFLLFYQLFAANALPYRILVFATQVANLLLFSWIALRLTGSRLAALAAPLLWTANSVLSTAMSWTSDYNEIQCAFFLLAAFTLYLQGRYWLQLVAFVLGFGALELNIVYPALLLAYLVFTRPSKRELLRIVPLFAISALYFAWHSAVAPRAGTGPYALHLDAEIFRTLATYWRSVLVPTGWTANHASWLTVLAVAVVSAVLLGHVLAQIRAGRRIPLFYLLWFVITLAPLLPLRDHISDYYLTIPSLGIAALWADCLTADSSRLFRILASVAALFYLSVQVPYARAQTHWFFERSREVRNLVLGVDRARHLHPSKTILLANVSPDLALLAIAHSPFHALGIPDVYLTPQSASQLAPSGALAPVEQFILAPGPTLHGLAAAGIEVYSAAGSRLRNITALYEQVAPQQIRDEVPKRVDLSMPLLGYLLGSTWYPLEGDHRWMPRRASVRMGGPSAIDGKLTLSGFCPSELTESGPLELQVVVDGSRLSKATISKPETSFSRTFLLPPAVAGKNYVEVTLEVSRTFQSKPGERELGLAFGTFEIR